MHDVPFASKANGFEGLDTELEINGKVQVKHIARLLEMAKEGRSNMPAATMPRTNCWSRARPASILIRRPHAATW